MRVTKRIEGYIHDEVSKIAEIKRGNPDKV